jgi:hypothetical protein
MFGAHGVRVGHRAKLEELAKTVELLEGDPSVDKKTLVDSREHTQELKKYDLMILDLQNRIKKLEQAPRVPNVRRLHQELAGLRGELGGLRNRVNDHVLKVSTKS